MHIFVRTSLALIAIAGVAVAGVRIAPPNPDDAWADPDPKPVLRVPPKWVESPFALEPAFELSLTIMPDGRVDDVQIEFSSIPHRGFEETTIEAIKQWRYHPQLRAGIITARPDVRVKVRYRLDRSE